MPTKRHTILIVDDEPDILDSLALSLEVDYDVLTATSGFDALDLLEKHEVALIISDQRMPKMTGVEFLAKAEELAPDTVRMMLTGFADFDAIVGAINKGQVYRYISKPWEPEDLAIDVRTAIERFSMQHSLNRRMSELQALCEIGATITSVLDSEQVVQKVLDGVVGALGFDRSHLMIVDEDSNKLVTGGSAGVEGEALSYLQELEYDLVREDVGVVLSVKENRPILVEDVDNAPVKLDQETLDRVGYRSFVTAPITAAGRRIGVLVADRTAAGERVTEHDQRLLMGFADQAAIAMENARLYEEALEKKRLEEEVGVAARIQERLLPESLPDVDGFELAAVSKPSRGVSGDYYDVVEMEDGKLWVAVGDVCGKGIPAAITMATLRTLFRSHIDRESELPEIMQRVSIGLFSATSPEVFATFCFGVLDPVAKTFTYVNAGHPFPVHSSVSSTVGVEGVGIPVGLDPLIWSEPYEEQHVQLADGDVLVIYSDGVAEAGAMRDDMFGEERLEKVVAENRGGSAMGVQEAVCDAVETFMGGDPMDDDLTLVVVKVKP
jgi:serine phosphatase RsbU (regulator of sigma subunit)/CheY-like chemotaxis protein